MKRLCLVIPSLQPGGMERVMSELADYFCQQCDLEVHLVMYGKKPELFYHLPEELKIHQPESHFYENLRLLSTFGRLIFLRKEIRSIQPAYVLSFGEYWNNFVLIALAGLKLQVFVSDRCQPSKKLGVFHDFMRKILYRKSAGVIIQTEKAREIYRKILPNSRLKVIGNPIRKIPPDPKVKRENIVLSVGMLITSKHFDSLIKLFYELNLPDWKLVIVGDDANRQHNKVILNDLVKELHFEDRIILAGLHSNVDTLYRKSKIFAFTSSSEGFPNVIGEAMSAGLPVVAFDCVAGPSEMISDSKDGFLVPLFDFAEFKKKLSLLINENRLIESMGNEAMRNARRFAIDIIGKEYHTFITSGF